MITQLIIFNAKKADIVEFYNVVSEILINNSIIYYSGKLSRQVILRKYNIQYKMKPVLPLKTKYFQLLL
jgi:hypothetical protein